ncbi:hypothetical protein ACFLRA_02930 [Bdellovibrionota bacterium]
MITTLKKLLLIAIVPAFIFSIVLSLNAQEEQKTGSMILTEGEKGIFPEQNYPLEKIVVYRDKIVARGKGPGLLNTIRAEILDQEIRDLINSENGTLTKTLKLKGSGPRQGEMKISVSGKLRKGAPKIPGWSLPHSYKQETITLKITASNGKYLIESENSFTMKERSKEAKTDKTKLKIESYELHRQ